MTTIFIGGSRHVSRLPPEACARLDTIIGAAQKVVVGDAAGVDTAVQRHFRDAAYMDVTVFCSGTTCRNNVGAWPTRNVGTDDATKGYRFYAAKDREMARVADLGLMVWDGESPRHHPQCLAPGRRGQRGRPHRRIRSAVDDVPQLGRLGAFHRIMRSCFDRAPARTRHARGMGDAVSAADGHDPRSAIMKAFFACAALLPALLAGCAPKPQPVAPAAVLQPAPGPEYEAALHALIDCGLRQIVRLDDGRTDANTVARAAASRCGREKAGFRDAAMSRAATQRAALAVNSAVDDATQTTFASLVLEVRAYRRERGARGTPEPSGPARRRLDEVAL
jgi:hypothetical protein